MPEIRLIDANMLLEKCKKAYDFEDRRGQLGYCIAAIKDAPTIDAIPREKWNELKETIIEMRDNGGTGTQEVVCKFLVNLMGIIERENGDEEDA